MAAKFRLCSFKTCPWVQRAAIVLRAKGIEYDIEYIDRDNRPAECSHGVRISDGGNGLQIVNAQIV